MSLDRELVRLLRLMGRSPHMQTSRKLCQFMCLCMMVVIIGCCLMPRFLNCASGGDAGKMSSTLHTSVAAKVKIPAGGIFDVIVMGCGVAGLSAAIYAARAGLTVLVLGSSAGAQLAATENLENYPGWQEPSRGLGAAETTKFAPSPSAFLSKTLVVGGPGLLSVMKSQAQLWGATFALDGTMAVNLTLNREPFEIVPSAPVFAMRTLRSHALIAAMGASPRRLHIPGEGQLWGTYLHSCVLCDGNLYIGKAVLVVGGGDAAVDAASYLATISKRVILVHRRSTLKASNVAAITALRSIPNVEVLMPYAVQRWLLVEGSGKSSTDVPQLLGAQLQTTNASGVFVRVEKCSGAFIMIGSEPNTQVLSGAVQLDNDGYVALKSHTTATSVPGVFAAGEIADVQYRQAITSAGEGAKAAIDAVRWLQGRRITKGGFAVPITAREPHQSLEPQHIEPLNNAMPHIDESYSNCNLLSLDCIKSIVETHPVVVFSKDWCPFCRRALETLSSEGVTAPKVIDLTGPSGPEVQQLLARFTGRRTVPNVFVGGKSIGGGDETVELHERGKLTSLLRSAGALA